MPNSPHPDKLARTWRLPKKLIAAVEATATRRGTTIRAVVVEALTAATSEPLRCVNCGVITDDYCQVCKRTMCSECITDHSHGMDK